MIEPYNAVGLIPTFWGIRRREDMAKNLEHIESLTHAAFWLSNLDIPVRLIAIPEGGLQGFNDEVLDVDHAEFARTCAIDIPGPETDRLGKLAQKWGVFVMAQAKARHEEWPDRFFNVGFIIDPDGVVILKHYKIRPERLQGAPVFAARPVRLVVRKIRAHLAGVLAGGRHSDRPPWHHDGDGGQLSGKWPRARVEWSRGCLSRLIALPIHRERLLRDHQPGSGARKQFLRRRAEHRRLSPLPG